MKRLCVISMGIVSMVWAACCLPLVQATSQTVPPAAQSTAAQEPALALVKVGGRTINGIFLNSSGHIAIPADGGAEAEYVVMFEGQSYPAKVEVDDSPYGLLILKMVSAKPLPVTRLNQGFLPQSGNRLVSLDGQNGLVKRPISTSHPRHNLAAHHLIGDFLEITLLGEVPGQGAALQNTATGEVYGLLLPAVGPNAERYILSTYTISSRASEKNIPLGDGMPVSSHNIVFANGSTLPAHSGLLPFSALVADRASISRVHAVHDLQQYTGFQINSLTTPQQDGTNLYFGSTGGALYCLDTQNMQQKWRLENEHALLYPPSISGDSICFSTGSLALQSLVNYDKSFGLLLATQIKGVPPGTFDVIGDLFIAKTVRRYMLDYGLVTCVDRKTNRTLWRYPNLWLTRFLSQPQIAGDKVMVGGVNTLAVLDLATGKPLWETSSDKREGNPVFYVVAGGDDTRMWTLKLTGRLAGDYSIKNPLRIEQASQAPEVECYSLTELENKQGKRLWSRPIQMPPSARALSATLILSPDHKVCYGATSQEVFAIDAEKGNILWQKKVFQGSFDGNLAYADTFLFVTDSANQLHALNALTGDVLWTFKDCKNRLCTPLVHQGKVYVGSQDTCLYALNAQDGKWVWKFETTGKVCGQPRIIGSKIYCATDDGRLAELDLP